MIKNNKQEKGEIPHEYNHRPSSSLTDINYMLILKNITS